MFGQNQNGYDGEIPLANIYKSYEKRVQELFQQLNTDALEKIKARLNNRQNIEEQQENKNRLEHQRGKIIDSMRQHVNYCGHPHCKNVQEIVMLYDLFTGIKKPATQASKDYLSFIVKKQNLGPKKTQCPVGSFLNKKMLETHHLLKQI